MQLSKVKPADFIKDKEYVQTDFNKHLGEVIDGRAIYRGRKQTGYVFEDLKGNFHTLSEDDLKANPMVTMVSTVKQAMEREREKRVVSLGGKYKHDPQELVRQAHAYRYGSKPHQRNIGDIETEDTEDILAYRANVGRQDYVLMIAKKENGLPDYTNYSYGMAFGKGIPVEKIKVGEKYYVENRPMKCTDKTDNSICFEPVKGKGKEQTWFSVQHIRAYNTVQKDARKTGELEAKNPTKAVSESNMGVVRQIIAKNVEDVNYKQLQVPIRPKVMSLYTRASVDATERNAQAMNAYMGVEGSENPNRITNKNIKLGETYLTPFGHRVYEGNFSLDSREWTKEEVRDRYFQIAKTGDYYTAQDFYKKRKYIYKFKGLFLTRDDLLNGIVLKKLTKGKEYMTPDGVAVYTGQVKDSQAIYDEVQAKIKDAISNYTDLEQIDYLISQGVSIPKMETVLAGFSTPFRNAIMELMTEELYQFGDNAYSFATIVSGMVYEKTDEKKLKSAKRKSENRKIEESYQRQQKTAKDIVEKETETGKDNTGLKVSYKKIVVGECYSTPYGHARYLGKERKKGKYNYYFESDFASQVAFTLENLVDGYIWQLMNVGDEFYYNDRLCVYNGYEQMANGLAGYMFIDKETGKGFYCGAKAFMKGKIRRAVWKGGK